MHSHVRIRCKEIKMAAMSLTIKKTAEYIKRIDDYRAGRLSYDTLFLNVTSHCNANCVFCEVRSLDHSRDMSAQRIMQIMNEAHDMGIAKIFFSGGEPFVMKDIWLLIGHALTLRMKVSVVSNGLLVPSFGREQFDLLKKTDSIDISLESHIPAEHNRLRGGGDFFDKTVQGIRLLRQHGILVNINTVISTANYLELAALIAFVRKLDVEMINFQPLHIWSNYHDALPRSKTAYALDAATLADFDKSMDQALAMEKSTGQKSNLKRIRPWIKQYFLAQLKNDGRIWMKDVVPDFKCVEVFTKLFLHSDGGVQPCAMLSPLDNAADKTLADAVKCLRKTKAMIRQGQFPEECHKCSCQMMLNYNFSVMINPLTNIKNAVMLALDYLR